MKVTLRLFTVLLACAAISMTYAADEFKYLTFKDTDGTETSYSLKNGLSITFLNAYMTVKNSEGSKRIRIKKVDKMFFTAEPTAATATTVEGITFSSNNGNVLVDAPVGTTINVCNVNGISETFKSTTTETIINLSQFGTGTYVIKATNGDLSNEIKIQK